MWWSSRDLYIDGRPFVGGGGGASVTRDGVAGCCVDANGIGEVEVKIGRAPFGLWWGVVGMVNASVFDEEGSIGMDGNVCGCWVSVVGRDV
jgi:hypothetical protein